MKFIGECCWTPYLGREEKEAVWGRGRSNAVSMEASADPVDSVGDRMTLQCCPELVRGLGLYLCENELLIVDFPGQDTEAKATFLAEAVPQDVGMLTVLLNCCHLRDSRYAEEPRGGELIMDRSEEVV